MGVIYDRTPPVVSIGSTFGFDYVTLARGAPGTAIALCDERGMWRTTDRGRTWNIVGVPQTYDNSGTAFYLDSPVCAAINPANNDHYICTQGVRGETLGFWVTTNAGRVWTSPPAFRALASATTTNDVTSMAVDPTDFNHILLGSHSTWQGGAVAGLMRTQDGGTTWTTVAPVGTWPSGSLGVMILSDPPSGQGNSSTWLVMTDGNGYWRTTNAGSSWTQVSTNNIVHHGCRGWYDSQGRLWVGGQPYPMFSTDNGISFTQATSGLSNSTYYTVVGDGTNLYTQVANTGDNGGGGGGGSALTYMTTSETSPGTWVPFTAQTFFDGPFNMEYDPVNKLMWSANWRTGVQQWKVA